ncbi:MAG TPA: hypothetical protein VGP47_07890 [Parachlamydiaceae bacterium]|nr:hypothetical protein [Parachlamydiaceae bacterium]
MLKFWVVGFPMLFSSLFSFFGANTDPNEKNEALMAKIVNTSTKQLSKRYGLITIGGGGGHVDNKSKREAVSFHLHCNLEKQEARALMVEVVELLLYNINNNNHITTYLYDNPFTYKNLEIRIFIYSNDGSNVYHPNLGLIGLSRRGTVYFVTYENGTNFNYATDKEEPYEVTYKLATGNEYSESH